MTHFWLQVLAGVIAGFGLIYVGYTLGRAPRGLRRSQRGRSQMTQEAARQWWLDHPEEAEKMKLPPDGRLL